MSSSITEPQLAILTLIAGTRERAGEQYRILDGADLRVAKRLREAGLLERVHHPCAASWAFRLTPRGRVVLAFAPRQQALLAELRAQLAAVEACTLDDATTADLDTAAAHLAEVHAFGACARNDKGQR
jgi:DNA-binding MarR family transcriptional regulator